MKKAMNCLMLGFIIMLILIYALGWFDLIENKMLTGNILKDLKKSFRDYLGAIYYFRYIILIGSILLAFIIYGINIGVEKLRG
jgi:membrane-anchored glycerophosphoryl diester phosphodiesterase (GDPDase)